LKADKLVKRNRITLTNRRNVMAGANIAGLSLSFPAQSKEIQDNKSLSSDGKPRTYVLVHGAWHGGWCWRDVAKSLEDNGHRVFTPTLTGLAER